MKKILLALTIVMLGLTPFLSGCSSLDDSASALSSGSDSDVQREVIDRLQRDEVTTRTTFDVTVDGGVVTLTGVVPGPNVRARAVSIARGTPGVKDVVDNLRRF